MMCTPYLSSRKAALPVSFWDIVWFIIITFAFVAYLMVLFAIITDLFRDRGTSGWLKAVWIIALIFLPLITSLVYLIARGKGMTERNIAAYESAKTAQDSYIRQVASDQSPAEQIAAAKALLDSGTISQAEFEALKAKALA